MRVPRLIVHERRTCDRAGGGGGRGALRRSGPPRPARSPQGCDSGERVTQHERTPPPDDRPRPPRAQKLASEYPELDLENLGETPNDAVRTLGDARSEAYALAVDPDAAEPEALRRGHVPLEVVAHHPRVPRKHSQALQDVAIHRLVGLARAELALDEDHVEVAAEIEGLYLAPLLALVAVGDEGHGHSALTQPTQRLFDAWEEAHGLPTASGVIFGDGEGESFVGRAQTHEAVCHD